MIPNGVLVWYQHTQHCSNQLTDRSKNFRLLPYAVVLLNAVVDVDSVDLFKSRLDNFWMFQDVKYDYTVDLADTGDRYEYDNESQWRVVEVFQEWYGHWGSSEAATVNIIDLTWLDLRQHTRQNAACTVFAGEDISRLTCPQFEGKMIYAHTPVIYQIYWSQHMSIHSGQQHESHSKL